MKRTITTIILAYWLIFFGLHAMGALAGTLTVATLSSFSSAVAAFASNGAIRAMPLISAGMGTVSLLVATLFLWAFLSNIFARQSDADAGEVEKIAFGGAGLVFTMLTALAIVDAEPAMLASATSYFAALLLSWIATRMEFAESWLPVASHERSIETSSIGTDVARAMASSAAHQNLLAKIAGRERN